MFRYFIISLFITGVLSTGCHKEKKTYTTPSVTKEFKESFDEIKTNRREGNLGKAAKLTIKLGNRIIKEYPTATMYREYVIKFLSYGMRISRLCRDKELELKNESTRPEEAEVYVKYAKDIGDIATVIRKKLPSIQWLRPPKPKKVEPKPTNDGTATPTEKPAAKPATDGEKAPVDNK